MLLTTILPTASWREQYLPATSAEVYGYRYCPVGGDSALDNSIADGKLGEFQVDRANLVDSGQRAILGLRIQPWHR
jgi:hypothetical protein